MLAAAFSRFESLHVQIFYEFVWFSSEIKAGWKLIAKPSQESGGTLKFPATGLLCGVLNSDIKIGTTGMDTENVTSGNN